MITIGGGSPARCGGDVVVEAAAVVVGDEDGRRSPVGPFLIADDAADPVVPLPHGVGVVLRHLRPGHRAGRWRRAGGCRPPRRSAPARAGPCASAAPVEALGERRADRPAVCPAYPTGYRARATKIFQLTPKRPACDPSTKARTTPVMCGTARCRAWSGMQVRTIAGSRAPSRWLDHFASRNESQPQPRPVWSLRLGGLRDVALEPVHVEGHHGGVTHPP